MLTTPVLARAALACLLAYAMSVAAAQTASALPDPPYDPYTFIDGVTSFGLLDPEGEPLTWLVVADPDAEAVEVIVGLGNAIGVETFLPAPDPVAYLQFMFARRILTPFTRLMMESLIIDDPASLFDRAVDAELIDEEQRATLELFVAEARILGPIGILNRDPFSIFVLGVCNGLEDAPESGAEARRLLPIQCGIAIADTPALVSIDEIRDLLTSPDFGRSIGDRYRAPASPIDRRGAQLHLPVPTTGG